MRSGRQGILLGLAKRPAVQSERAVNRKLDRRKNGRAGGVAEGIHLGEIMRNVDKAMARLSAFSAVAESSFLIVGEVLPVG